MTTNPPVHTVRRGLHPMLWIAAGAVTIFAIAGTAYVTGLLPRHDTAPTATAAAPASAQQAPAPASASVAPATPTAPATPATPSNAASAAPPAPVAAAVPAPAKPRVVSSRPHAKDNAAHSTPLAPDNGRSYSSRGESGPPAICRECGVVESNRAVTKEGEGSGLGAVAGGVVGGVLGNNVGQGNGRNLATIAGAIGGAMLGNKIEKNQRQTVTYQTTVRLEDGTSRVFVSDQQSPWQPGDRVKIVDGRLTPR